MPAFLDLDTSPRERLLITEATPGELVKSPLEELVPALPGQPDSLTLYYDALVRSYAEINDLLLDFTTGTNLSTEAVTDGTWIGGPAKLISRPEELPFVRYAVPCLGLAKAKPNAVRWFGATETQSVDKIQAEIIAPGVEIDTILIGSAPDMSEVGTFSEPADPPAIPDSPWVSLEDPTLHYPSEWFLADLRAQQLFGSPLHWLVTYVWRFKFPYSP